MAENGRAEFDSELIDLANNITKSLPHASPVRVREIPGVPEETVTQLQKYFVFNPDKGSYEFRFHFNDEDNTSYVHIRRLA